MGGDAAAEIEHGHRARAQRRRQHVVAGALNVVGARRDVRAAFDGTVAEAEDAHGARAAACDVRDAAAEARVLGRGVAPNVPPSGATAASVSGARR